MIDAELNSRLLGDGAVVAIVADRIYPMRAAQEAPFPFVRWQRVSRSQVAEDALDGIVTPVQARVQVDSYANTYSGARALADTITAALEGWGDPVVGTVRFVRLDSERDTDESDDKVRIVRVSQDWLITFDH